MTVPPPSAVSSALHAAASASLRPVMRTLAPARANTRAMPLPIPLVPPVTMTERPAMELNMDPPGGSAVLDEVLLGEVAGRPW